MDRYLLDIFYTKAIVLLFQLNNIAVQCSDIIDLLSGGSHDELMYAFREILNVSEPLSTRR